MEILEGVTSIGDGAFEGCESLESINVDKNNKNYTSVSGVLYNKDVTKLIQCPGGVSSIEIPDSVTSIGDVAFRGCSRLKSIMIPNSVTSIGWGAFWGCESLKEIRKPKGLDISRTKYPKDCEIVEY
ncbi:MAG: leucine-rich repeat domain-containing protein [Abditibacteriota bacterium]|nr:leucine-rich repeat domain-containing protein [Abditibacteriota bacterium]